MRFTVGLKLEGQGAQHVVVDGEDALIAALKVKSGHPDALILYVRPQKQAWRCAPPRSPAAS